MTILKNLFRLRRHEMVEGDVLEELFSMERGTLITLMLLETILLYILMPLLGKPMAAWYGIAISISLWRYYNAYDYQKHPGRNSPVVWHKKLIVQVWLTALLFSILALFAMPKLDAYYQLFVFIVLVGISSGAVKALSRDHRTAVGYLTIMLFPLSVEMLLLMREDTYILAFLVVIYYFTQMNVILRSYEQFMILKRNEREIATAKAKLHEKQEMMQRFFEQATEGIISYDIDMMLLDCNGSFAELFGMEKEELTGATLASLPNKNLERIAKESLGGKMGTYNGLHYRQNDEELWIEAKFSPLHDHKGNIVGGMGLVVDRTSEHMAQQELEYLVFHDPLTSISNRRGFRQYMSELIKREEHATRYSLLYYLDLNKFKQINDIFGHETGDKVLIEAVHRLKRLSDDTCNLTRLGGDEFCVVVPFAGIVRSEVEEIMEE
jgi:PAS domain S-box-containing protein